MTDFRPKQNTYPSTQKRTGHTTGPEVAARRRITWLSAVPRGSAVRPREAGIVIDWKLHSAQINKYLNCLRKSLANN